ncbi:MAG TPA: alpha-glucan family phosphorylase [Burkholderiales bacterium]|nr:alpha-glucan family phosphorylase [Burkholderiales bacterium]
MPSGTRYFIEVNPRIPKRLARLEELAANLWYSWDRPTRALFAKLNPVLWDAVGHSPKAMLKRVDEQRLIDAAADPAFLDSLTRVLAAFDAYHAEPPFQGNAGGFRPNDLVAYFCAEFGVHESLPIYSGGLGILAGDHCKAASDFKLPFVAVGLLYRQGYFVQAVDGEGRQRAEYNDSDFDDLPIEPVDAKVEIPFPGRKIHARIWRARIGHATLYLLDTDVPENNERDRSIAYRLYGGDRTTRIEQELVLGVGGVRALAAVGLKPSAWHINEGHAAFLVLERTRQLMLEGLSMEAALEAVAANTVFTTHTPVPAGHDHFPDAIVLPYLRALMGEMSGDAKFPALGRPPAGGDFNMTALAIRGSRYHNGVSRIHGGVSQQLLKDFWPQVSPEENPVDYITNAVHVPTFLAPEWGEVLERFLGVGWMHRLGYPGIWEKIREIPDHIFWSVRQDINARLLHMVRHRIAAQHARNHGSESHLERLLRHADPAKPNVLTIGFGRRFATYKRATLLFSDLDQLRRLVADKDRPVLFLFAGKAHPADEPGQELIRGIHHLMHSPEFEGRVLFIEGYDLHIARRLVSGVDVWLNNPVYPLEASGTSGMKAGMNGVINLSILDGWWGEGYDGDNGWAIKPASPELDAYRRDREEARTLYEILQDRVIPTYYARENGGGVGAYSPQWIRMAKRSMASLLPRYDASRMLGEYVTKFYLPASRQGHRYSENGYEGAKTVAAWKSRVRAAWDGVSARRLDMPRTRIRFGESIPVEVAVKLNGLAPTDVCVELLLSRALRDGQAVRHTHELSPEGPIAETSEQRYRVELKPGLSGRLDYQIRIFPRHPLLTHPFELGLQCWV